MSVTLVREIRYQGSLVGSPYQTTVTNSNGTFNDSVTYSLPNNATPGVYTVDHPVDEQLRHLAAGSVF